MGFSSLAGPFSSCYGTERRQRPEHSNVYPANLCRPGNQYLFGDWRYRWYCRRYQGVLQVEQRGPGHQQRADGLGRQLRIPRGFCLSDQIILWADLMARRYPVYKGLQKPLIFKGFKGKFIYWGLGSILAGLVSGALIMSLVNMWFGAIVLIGCMVGGLLYTAGKQKGGLHDKGRANSIYILNHYVRKNTI